MAWRGGPLLNPRESEMTSLAAVIGRPLVPSAQCLIHPPATYSLMMSSAKTIMMSQYFCKALVCNWAGIYGVHKLFTWVSFPLRHSISSKRQCIYLLSYIKLVESHGMSSPIFFFNSSPACFLFQNFADLFLTGVDGAGGAGRTLNERKRSFLRCRSGFQLAFYSLCLTHQDDQVSLLFLWKAGAE